MRLLNLPIDQAVGATLVHNVMGADGRKALSKGRVVRREDIATLRALKRETVYVAALEPGDVPEDEAAARLAQLVAGQGIDVSKPSGGRVNFHAAARGLLRIEPQVLNRINRLAGVTLATVPRWTLLAPRKLVATLKTIGLALPQATLDEAAAIVRRDGAVLSLAGITNTRVAVVLTGSENGRARVVETFSAPIRARVEAAGAQVIREEFVTEEEGAIAAAVQGALDGGAQMVIVAGETSIMDAHDITPRGIERAGCTVEVYGAPVEPGNLLLIAYCGAAAVIGAPGCIKSRETNVVDLVLPRLLAGDRVTRADVIALAEGGLLVGSA